MTRRRAKPVDWHWNSASSGSDERSLPFEISRKYRAVRNVWTDDDGDEARAPAHHLGAEPR